MSQCTVPDWNLRHQRQEQLQKEETNRNTSSHVHKQLHNPTTCHHHLVPMPNYEVAELTWENGQLAMHGLGGFLHSSQTKPTWGRTGETLESIVHQATCQKQNLNSHQHQHQPQLQPQSSTPTNITPVVSSTEGKWAHNLQVPATSSLMKKRTRSESRNFNVNNNVQDHEHVDRSACASASATFYRDSDASMKTWASLESPRSLKNKTTDEDSANFCRDNDTTMMTWPSFESPRSLKTKTTDEDSACHGGSENQDEDRETKTETVRSHSISRRSRAAAVHNQSERRRRDRINQKMKALQKLVPNASKTDKASMLDEVIDYLKQLQAQVQMMNARNMPQMMMPIGMQQQLQMSLLSRMGMGVGLGMGMGMLDMSNMARTTAPQSLPQLIHHPTPVTTATPAFVPSPFVVPSLIPTHNPARANPDPATNSSVPLPDPYCAFLVQSMNMELYNKMAALYQQQVSQTTTATSGTPPSHSNHVQGD